MLLLVYSMLFGGKTVGGKLYANRIPTKERIEMEGEGG